MTDRLSLFGEFWKLLSDRDVEKDESQSLLENATSPYAGSILRTRIAIFDLLDALRGTAVADKIVKLYKTNDCNLRIISWVMGIRWTEQPCYRDSVEALKENHTKYIERLTQAFSIGCELLKDDKIEDVDEVVEIVKKMNVTFSQGSDVFSDGRQKYDINPKFTTMSLKEVKTKLLKEAQIKEEEGPKCVKKTYIKTEIRGVRGKENKEKVLRAVIGKLTGSLHNYLQSKQNKQNQKELIDTVFQYSQILNVCSVFKNRNCVIINQIVNIVLLAAGMKPVVWEDLNMLGLLDWRTIAQKYNASHDGRSDYCTVEYDLVDEMTL